MPHELMAEINVCKTIRQKIYVIFCDMIVQSAVACESGRVPLRQSVYFGINKPILYFPHNFYVPSILTLTVYFHVPFLVDFTVYFHTVISMLLFLCY